MATTTATWIDNDAAGFIAALLMSDWTRDEIRWLLDKPERWQAEFETWKNTGKLPD